MAAVAMDADAAGAQVETPAQVATVDQASLDASDNRDANDFRFSDLPADSQQRQLDQARQVSRLELVFVDTGAEDYQQLVDDLLNGADSDRELEVYLLDSMRDGIEQISQVLAGYDDVDAVHLVSHGSEGQVKLGNTWLNTDNLDGYAGEIAGWNDALRDGGVELLPAGCSEADGASALRWVRSRSTQEFVDGEWRFVEGVSDLTRNARQQQLLLALLAELKGLRTPGALADLAGEVSDAVQLDETLSMGEAIGLAWDLRRVSASSIQRPTIPVEATATDDGSFALVPLAPFLEVIGAG